MTIAAKKWNSSWKPQLNYIDRVLLYLLYIFLFAKMSFYIIIFFFLFFSLSPYLLYNFSIKPVKPLFSSYQDEGKIEHWTFGKKGAFDWTSEMFRKDENAFSTKNIFFVSALKYEIFVNFAKNSSGTFQKWVIPNLFFVYCHFWINFSIVKI